MGKIKPRAGLLWAIVLVTLASLLAGCAAGNGVISPSPTDPTASPSVSVAPTPTPSASATATDDTVDAEDDKSSDETQVEETDVRLPADVYGVHSEEWAKFLACGNELDKSSLIPPTADDEADFVIKGEGLAVPELESFRCRAAKNPTVGDMVMRTLANSSVPSGQTIGQLNPKIVDFNQKSADKGLLAAWVFEDKDGNVRVNEEYQRGAFMGWLLLKRLKHEGVQPGRATWHTPLNAQQVDDLPKVFTQRTSYQGEFIILAYTRKGQRCAWYVLGVNTRDGRLANLANGCQEKVAKDKEVKQTSEPKKAPAKVVKQTTSKPTPTPRPTQTQTPKPTPTATQTPKPTPTATQTPKPKDPAKDPSAKDNAGNGGGKNQDSGPGTYIPPADMERPTETTTVNTVKASAVSPTTTQTTAPVVRQASTAAPTRTVDPAPQANDGSVAPSPAPSAVVCNLTFQDC